MNKLEKEIETIFLDEEEKVLKDLKSTYSKSLKDVKAYAKKLQNDLDKLMANIDEEDENAKTLIRSKVYQIEYQNKLIKQIEGYMNVIADKNIKTISDYLNVMYMQGFLTQNYALNKQGVNITMPINQKLLAKAVSYNTNNITLSTRLYKNVEKAKKDIVAEISRGLSIGASTHDMARNLENTMGVSTRKAYQIAQNEGARVREDAIIDSLYEAKSKGADIVKRWSATLDGKTRPVHRELEGKWVELEDYFEYSGGKVFAPKQFGIASEDINCRCTIIGVPRWELEETYVKRDNTTGQLVKVKNYDDWYNNFYSPLYYKKISEITTKNGIIVKTISSHLSERIIERNITIEDIEDALTKPLDIGDEVIDSLGRSSQRFIGEKATVIINNRSGNIATVWKTGKRTIKKLKGGKNGKL